ncbi:hypothetical protein Hamer_G012098 [Homarus americanus]|uniref:Uncharacterized protein n=1 Tax=Homarus americanus TaxID=6706 RepID=A0A8J5JCH7_HOMAM|nr:hypothetical protein Hamer_G012098 [Homarus americanus]
MREHHYFISKATNTDLHILTTTANSKIPEDETYWKQSFWLLDPFPGVMLILLQLTLLNPQLRTLDCWCVVLFFSVGALVRLIYRCLQIQFIPFSPVCYVLYTSPITKLAARVNVLCASVKPLKYHNWSTFMPESDESAV